MENTIDESVLSDEVLDTAVLEDDEILDDDVLDDPATGDGKSNGKGKKSKKKKTPAKPLNGFYDKEGNYLGTDNVANDEVYEITRYTVEFMTDKDGKVDWEGIKSPTSSRKLDTKHSAFIMKCSAVYGESSVGYGIVSKEEMYAIASVHTRNSTAYAVTHKEAKAFRAKSLTQRNNIPAMRMAIAAFINALQGGEDYSNGAVGWDGMEQGQLDGTACRVGRFTSHAAGIGWTIHTSHYNSWKDTIEGLFPGTFTAPQHCKALSACSSLNAGLYRYESTAQYAGTIFWKDRGMNATEPIQE